MPRQARKRSESGIYHIMLRGINRQQIFEDDEDRIRFLETLQSIKSDVDMQFMPTVLWVITSTF